MSPRCAKRAMYSLRWPPPPQAAPPLSPCPASRQKRLRNAPLPRPAARPKPPKSRNRRAAARRWIAPRPQRGIARRAARVLRHHHRAKWSSPCLEISQPDAGSRRWEPEEGTHRRADQGRHPASATPPRKPALAPAAQRVAQANPARPPLPAGRCPPAPGPWRKAPPRAQSAPAGQPRGTDRKRCEAMPAPAEPRAPRHPSPSLAGWAAHR